MFCTSVSINPHEGCVLPRGVTGQLKETIRHGLHHQKDCRSDLLPKVQPPCETAAAVESSLTVRFPPGSWLRQYLRKVKRRGLTRCFVPWSALSTRQGRRCGCGRFGCWAFGGFTSDTRGAGEVQRACLGRWPGQRCQVCIWEQLGHLWSRNWPFPIRGVRVQFDASTFPLQGRVWEDTGVGRRRGCPASSHDNSSD